MARKSAELQKEEEEESFTIARRAIIRIKTASNKSKLHCKDDNLCIQTGKPMCGLNMSVGLYLQIE